MYMWKSLRSLRAGYLDLEEYDGDSWVPATSDDPYYVCARFRDGRHIPGPILADRAHQRGVQGFVVRVALALGARSAVAARDAFVAYRNAFAVRAERDALASRVETLEGALLRVFNLMSLPDPEPLENPPAGYERGYRDPAWMFVN